MNYKAVFLLIKVLLCLAQYTVESQISQASIGCGSSFCCLMWPKNCSPLTDCGIIIRYSYDQKLHMLNAEIRGNVDGWIAFGLSRKKGMMDGVKGEICYKQGSSVMLQQFQNEGTDFDFRGNVKGTIIKLLVNGTMTCSYRRPLHGPNMYDLTEPLYIVAAWGKMENEGSKVEPEEHPTGAYFWTSEKVDLKTRKCGKIETSKWTLIAVHGVLMVVAWIGFASIGILFMRYTRPLFGERMCLSSKIWFQAHRIPLFLTVSLTIAGVILVFVQAGSWRTEMGAHPYTGMVVVFFTILQPIVAFFRPNPSDKRRWIFNWAHRLGGLFTMVLAVVTIFLGMAYMEVSLVAVIIYLALIIIAILVMEYKQRCRSKTIVIQANDMEELYAEEDFDGIRLDTLMRKVFISFAIFAGGLFSLVSVVLIGTQATKLTKIKPS